MSRVCIHDVYALNSRARLNCKMKVVTTKEVQNKGTTKDEVWDMYMTGSLEIRGVGEG